MAIDEAHQAALKQELSNLRFQVADLMQPETLPSVPGGYDLILSYGVLHHLKNPTEGLNQLSRLLSPQGAIAFMVDGRFGRQPLDRYLQALALLGDEADPEQAREVRARALARVADRSLFRATHWQGTAETDPVEFADRCLHVHEQSFTVDELWALLSSAGLAFLRWLEPADWQASAVLSEPVLSEAITKLTQVDRYRLVERLCERPKLTLIAVPDGVRSRAELTLDSVDQAVFRLNPQLKALQQDGLSLWQLRNQSPRAAETRVAETLLKHAQGKEGGFSFGSITEMLMQEGYLLPQVRETLIHLVTSEWLYLPHSPSRGGDA